MFRPSILEAKLPIFDLYTLCSRWVLSYITGLICHGLYNFYHTRGVSPTWSLSKFEECPSGKHGNGISPETWKFLAGKIIELNGVFFQLATFDYWRVGLQISWDFRIPAPKRGFLCPLSTARFGPLGTLRGLRGALWLQGHVLQETLFLLIP